MDIQAEPTQALLSRLMDATALRHLVLTHNLANAETPGYLRQDVSFESELAEAMESGDLQHFQPTIGTDRTAPVRADGNSVALDAELAEINKNAMLHQMAIQLMQTKLTMQRIAITGKD